MHNDRNRDNPLLTDQRHNGQDVYKPIEVLDLSAMTRLYELSTRLIHNSSLEALLEEILYATIELQGADFGNVQLYDPTSATLSIVAQHGFGQPFLDCFHRVSAQDPGACGLALLRRKRVIIFDTETDPDFQAFRQIAATSGFRAVQSTPLFTRSGAILGMLSTHFRQPHRPSAQELKLTDLYARQASDMIERQRMEEELRRTNEALQVEIQEREQVVKQARHSTELLQGLYEVTLAVNSTLSPQSILALISEQARLLLKARYALTSLTQEEEWAQELVSVSSAPSRPDGALSTHERLVREQLAGLRDHYKSLAAQNSSADFMEAPLLERDGNEVGLVQLNERVEGAFTQEDRLVFLQFAQMTSLALSNARSHVQTREALASNQLTMQVMERAARSLQASLDAIHHSLETVQKGLLPQEAGTREPSQQLPYGQHRKTLRTLAEQIYQARITASQLEDLARLECGKPLTTTETNHIDLVALVQQTVKTLRPMLHNHRVIVGKQAPSIFLRGDMARIQQVLTYLLSNAVAASPPDRSIFVNLGCKTETREVIICVQDRGPGLSMEDQERIFDRQGWKRHMGQAPGIMPELYLSRAIVEQLGGHFWIINASGWGNRFFFSLPLRANEDEE